MSLLTASYDMVHEGWAFVYQLYPDKLVIRSQKGMEQREEVIDLRLATEFYHRGIHEQPIEFPAQVLLARLGIVVVGGLLFLQAAYAIGSTFWQVVVLAVMVALGYVACAVVPLIICGKNIHKFLTLRKHDDNDLASVWSKPNETSGVFDDFVQAILNLIGSAPAADDVRVQTARHAARGTPLAAYAKLQGGYQYTFELFPGRLVIRAWCGPFRREDHFDLSRVSEYFDRGVTGAAVERPVALAAARAGAALAASLLYWTLTQTILKPAPGLTMMATLVFACCLVALVLFMPRLVYPHEYYQYINFHHDDGSISFYLTSASNEPSSAFDDFIAEVIHEVRRAGLA